MDLHLLPDGRLLVIGPEEIAIGDGVRWDHFNRQAGSVETQIKSVAIDEKGQIYADMVNSFARIVFLDDASWTLERVQAVPPHDGYDNAQLDKVARVGDHWYWWEGAGPMVT
ncbi:MAG: hypothetical protein J6386_20620 [Candidatus Synoicihabitans palmerolidicus]|nr:hypothetical protein [Candidatus Synoicihabitans palmerolidicus]